MFEIFSEFQNSSLKALFLQLLQEMIQISPPAPQADLLSTGKVCNYPTTLFSFEKKNIKQSFYWATYFLSIAQKAYHTEQSAQLGS